MNLLCLTGLHSWSEIAHRPCERYQTCTRCGKERIFVGWHNFGDWSETYYQPIRHCIDVIGSHGDFVTEESRQYRLCNDCKIKDIRFLV